MKIESGGSVIPKKFSVSFSFGKFSLSSGEEAICRECSQKVSKWKCTEGMTTSCTYFKEAGTWSQSHQSPRYGGILYDFFHPLDDIAGDIILFSGVGGDPWETWTNENGVIFYLYLSSFLISFSLSSTSSPCLNRTFGQETGFPMIFLITDTGSLLHRAWEWKVQSTWEPSKKNSGFPPTVPGWHASVLLDWIWLGRFRN